MHLRDVEELYDGDERLLTETEKQTVRAQQIGPDGSLLCFIPRDIIGNSDEVVRPHRAMVERWRDQRRQSKRSAAANLAITFHA